MKAPDDWLEQWQEQAEAWQAEIDAARQRELATDDEGHVCNGDDPRQTDELVDDIPY